MAEMLGESPGWGWEERNKVREEGVKLERFSMVTGRARAWDKTASLRNEAGRGSLVIQRKILVVLLKGTGGDLGGISEAQFGRKKTNARGSELAKKEPPRYCPRKIIK